MSEFKAGDGRVRAWLTLDAMHLHGGGCDDQHTCRSTHQHSFLSMADRSTPEDIVVTEMHVIDMGDEDADE